MQDNMLLQDKTEPASPAQQCQKSQRNEVSWRHDQLQIDLALSFQSFVFTRFKTYFCPESPEASTFKKATLLLCTTKQVALCLNIPLLRLEVLPVASITSSSEFNEDATELSATLREERNVIAESLRN